MKKILTLCIAMIFIASYSITAQNTDIDTKTNKNTIATIKTGINPSSIRIVPDKKSIDFNTPH